MRRIRRLNRKLPPLMWKVSFSSEWRDDKLCFVFHNTAKWVVRKVFDKMNPLYRECDVTIELMPDIVNGKCFRSVVATITQPNEQLLAVNQWHDLIISYMKGIYDVDVKYFKDYEKFLNA